MNSLILKVIIDIILVLLVAVNERPRSTDLKQDFIVAVTMEMTGYCFSHVRCRLATSE